MKKAAKILEPEPDDYKWFRKLSPSQKLQAIEEQIKTISFFRKLKNAGRNTLQRNYRKVQ